MSKEKKKYVLSCDPGSVPLTATVIEAESHKIIDTYEKRLKKLKSTQEKEKKKSKRKDNAAFVSPYQTKVCAIIDNLISFFDEIIEKHTAEKDDEDDNNNRGAEFVEFILEYQFGSDEIFLFSSIYTYVQMKLPLCKITVVFPVHVRNHFKIGVKHHKKKKGGHSENKRQSIFFLIHNHEKVDFASTEIKHKLIRSNHSCDTILNYIILKLKGDRNWIKGPFDTSTFATTKRDFLKSLGVPTRVSKTSSSSLKSFPAKRIQKKRARLPLDRKLNLDRKPRASSGLRTIAFQFFEDCSMLENEEIPSDDTLIDF